MTDLVRIAIAAGALGALYALFALGIALVFGVMRLINFAYGELITIGAFVLTVTSDSAWPVWLLVTVGAVIGAAVLVERVAFRPLRGADPATLLVASFAVSYLLQNAIVLIFGATPRTASISGILDSSIAVGEVSIRVLDLVTIGLAAVLIAALALFLHRSEVGVKMRAASEDFPMAQLMAVRANLVIAVGFALSGVLAAVAAVVVVARTGIVTPTTGVSAVLVAFIATIIGGMGSLSGAAIAGFGLGVVTVTLQEVLPLELRAFRDAFVYALVIVALVVRPRGLVSRFEEERV
jgi:branched-chain amino acid transport system permease protein